MRISDWSSDVCSSDLYAILRSITFDIFFIPAKLIGVILMFGSILILFVLPWLDTSRVRSARYRPVYNWFFWVLVVDCIVLGWVGANPPDGWLDRTSVVQGKSGSVRVALGGRRI